MAKDDKPYIFFDTCSLLDSCWNSERGNRDKFVYSQAKDDMFWGHEFASLARMGDVIIPKRNYDELVKHAGNSKKPDLASRSKHVLQRIERLYKAGTLQIVGDSNDPFADALLLSVALKFKTQRHLAFITQDRGLAEDLQAICYFRSLNDHYGHPKYDIKVRRISTTGELQPFKGLEKALCERYEEVASQTSRSRANTGGDGGKSRSRRSSSQEDSGETTVSKKNWWDA